MDLKSTELFMMLSRYRNSYKHNLCLDMLQDGFHRAFCELFALLSNQKEMCLKNEREFSDMNIVLLEDDPEKLDTLQEHLIAAETAKRRGTFFVNIRLFVAVAFIRKREEWPSLNADV